MKQAYHCTMSISQKSPVVCTLIWAVCSKACYPTSGRGQKRNRFHSSPPGPTATQTRAETPVARQHASRKLWDLYGPMLGALRPKEKRSPPDAKDPTYRSRSGSGHWAIVAYPLGVRLFHCGALHVFPTGEDCLYHGQRVGTNSRQTHIVPVEESIRVSGG